MSSSWSKSWSNMSFFCALEPPACSACSAANRLSDTTCPARSTPESDGGLGSAASQISSLTSHVIRPRSAQMRAPSVCGCAVQPVCTCGSASCSALEKASTTFQRASMSKFERLASEGHLRWTSGSRREKPARRCGVRSESLGAPPGVRLSTVAARIRSSSSCVGLQSSAQRFSTSTLRSANSHAAFGGSAAMQAPRGPRPASPERWSSVRYSNSRPTQKLSRCAIFWKSPSKVGGSADGLWFQSRPDMAHVTVSADAQPSVHEPEPGSAASSSAYSCTWRGRRPAASLWAS
mmetsp:Transcript_42052/g.116184  ORF Transcript_42052/g.116184 Transcript_42052/m.116184 type:complete len:292 (+) Transcript_42052:101-976(+)